MTQLLCTPPVRLPGEPGKWLSMANAIFHQCPLPTWTVLKSVDARALTATGILTFPEYDWDGDWVEPTGGSWVADPYVNVEHEPPRVGSGSVEMKSLPDVGEVPIGTTHFDRNSRASSQAFGLVAGGVLTGYSLEYKPVGPLGGPYWKSLGHQSPRLDRDAMEFTRWNGQGWAVCARPVQPGARLLLPEYAEYEKAIRIVEANRLDGEQLEPTIFKSLSAVANRFVRPATVRSGWGKAMGGNNLYADPPGGQGGAAATADDSDQTGQGDQPTPAIKSYKQAAQTLLDVADFLKHHVSQSEHVGLRASVEDDAAKVMEIAQHLNGQADSAQDELDGKAKLPSIGDEGEDEGADDDIDLDADDATPTEGDDDDADAPPKKKPAAKGKPPFGKALNLRPMERDESGAILTKAYPGYTPARYDPDRVRRYRASEFEPVDEVPAEDAEQAKALATEIDAVRGQTKQIKRVYRDLQPLAVAASKHR